MKQKTNFNEKGITIIALIITIILLLILVGVSINLVIKGNLFGSAEKAVDGTNAKAEQEQTRVDELMGKLNSMKDKEANDSIITEIENGESLIYTAEGGMAEAAKCLQEYRKTVVQIANSYSSLTDSDLESKKELLKQLAEALDSIAREIMFNNEYLLDGSFNKNVGTSDYIVKIDDLSSESLGLNKDEIDNNLASAEAPNRYLTKIDQAIAKVSENRSRVGAVSNGLGTLKDFYKEENSILASNEANLDKKIAKHSLTSIESRLNRCIELCRTASNITDQNDLKSYETELEALIIAIDHIARHSQYNEQKLLDGTYGSISKINSTTLGGGTKLGTDVSTSEKAEALKIQYQNAVNMVENEIAKLGV